VTQWVTLVAPLLLLLGLAARITSRLAGESTDFDPRAAMRIVALLSLPVLLGFAAAILGSMALFALTVGCVLAWLGSFALTRWAAVRLVVTRTVDRHELLEGQAFTITYALKGVRGLPVRVEVQHAVGHWAPLDPVAPTRLPCVIDRPGAHVLESSLLRVRDDIGLLSRSVWAGELEALLVLPVPDPLAMTASRGGAELVGDPEPDGLRPYVAGTSMSRIHWPSASRGGALQERHFVTAQDQLPLVVVETTGVEDGPAIDWAARNAAGLLIALTGQGGCRVLLPGDRNPTTLTDVLGQWPAIHRRLAALEPNRAPLADAVARERNVNYVRARSAPADALAARTPLPPGIALLARWEEAT
jgi:uncharacterized protein (DUF58 family)